MRARLIETCITAVLCGSVLWPLPGPTTIVSARVDRLEREVAALRQTVEQHQRGQEQALVVVNDR